MEYLRRVRELGTTAEIGTSRLTPDGLNSYIMIHDDGVRRFGAVAYLKPHTGIVNVRLQAEEVTDVLGGIVTLRAVRRGHPNVVNCELDDLEAVSTAIDLTKRALDKVRG